MVACLALPTLPCRSYTGESRLEVKDTVVRSGGGESFLFTEHSVCFSVGWVSSSVL